MNAPLVTVICLCYNHERFVIDALQSVLQQTYSAVQLIVVDDHSKDRSVCLINQFVKDNPFITFIRHADNKGSCSSFNEALKLAKGEFVVDLAADDVLLADRIQIGVNALQQSGNDYGVHFSDAEIISEQGICLGNHSDRFPHDAIPQGDIYKELIKRYFICTPTLMFRKKILDELGGYDETLAFEDFDFLIRSSRRYKFVYSSVVLVKRRLVHNSMSQQQFKRSSDQRWSTLDVCKKIKSLNRSEEENRSLKIRLRYEILLSLKLLDFKLALSFYQLRRSI
ncbi:MAG: glycosyl transferase [Azospira oryzae]|nr:MAG: glycosyl transferase [Azospira oryzae]